MWVLRWLCYGCAMWHRHAEVACYGCAMWHRHAEVAYYGCAMWQILG
jgi:hypothetical protein